MAPSVKISQNTAIMLERARRFGITDIELLQVVQSGNLNPLKVAEAEHYSYDDFLSYAEEHGEPLEQAIREGYRMTFNTVNGLKIWLQEKFGLEVGRDFTGGEGRWEQLQLSAADAEFVKAALAANWQVIDLGGSDQMRNISLVVRALV